MKYKYCGRSGIQLPVVSLGLWHNFGNVDNQDEARRMILTAFEKGVCHFDLANNYGPPFGSAETNFGRIFNPDLKNHRDEVFISSKAGHDMWPGVYGTGSSRKNLIASCDASLRRTGLEYFDVFYSHRYDGVTPVEETMQALVDIVRSGKALYAGISKYPPAEQKIAYDYLRDAHVSCLLSQYRYSMFDRQAEQEGTFELAEEAGSGVICFSPLAQGLLTTKYFDGIPADSRVARGGYLKAGDVTADAVAKAKRLAAIAAERGESLPDMALAWVLANRYVTSVIVGTSSVNQLLDNLHAADAEPFTDDQTARIEAILAQ